MIYYIVEITDDSFLTTAGSSLIPIWYVTKDLVDIHTRLQQELKVLDLDNFRLYKLTVEEPIQPKAPFFYASIGEHRQIIQYLPEDADFTQKLDFSEETGLAELISI